MGTSATATPAWGKLLVGNQVVLFKVLGCVKLSLVEMFVCSFTEEERKLAKMQKRNQVFTALSGGLIAMSVGSSIALPSSLIPQVVEYGIAKDFAEASWLATGYLYAGIPACLVGGFISDIAGRRLMALLC